MGLDMYLTGERYLQSRERDRGQMKGILYDLGYWRKHPNLHGYIVTEFADADDCNPIHLSADRLSQIIAAVEGDRLPHTVGFFFGESDGSEKQRDLAIFRDALAWLEEADANAWRSVHYQASW